MKIITNWLKIFTIFVISTLFSTTALQAVNIPLENGSLTEIVGDLNPATCQTGDVFRVGTPATYGGRH
jgi:hypothetical protein